MRNPRLLVLALGAALLVASCGDNRAAALNKAVTVTSLSYAQDDSTPETPIIDDYVTVKGDLENTYASNDAPCDIGAFSLLGAGRTYTATSAHCEAKQIAPNTKTSFEARFPVKDTADIYTLRYKTPEGDYATKNVAIGVPTKVGTGPVNGANAHAARFFGFDPGPFTAWIARQSAVRCFPYLLVGVDHEHGFLGQSYRDPNFYGINDEHDFKQLPSSDDVFRSDDYGPQGPDTPPIMNLRLAYDPHRHIALGYFDVGDDYRNVMMIGNVMPPSEMNDEIEIINTDLTDIDNFHGTHLLGATRQQIESRLGSATYTAPCESLTATTYHHRSAISQGNTFATFIFQGDHVVAFAYDEI